ncbi:unnamed protein product, partial [Hapterophycus canaliculatus]
MRLRRGGHGRHFFLRCGRGPRHRVRQALGVATGRACRYRCSCLHQHRQGARQPHHMHIRHGGCCAPRMARFLLDQGADTTTHVNLQFDEWGVMSDTPVVAATLALQQADNIFNVDKNVVDGLKGVTRVLHLVEAVHAVSWWWPNVTDRPTGNKNNKPASIGRMLPILRKRA